VVLGEGCTPSPPARESGERCKLPQWVWAEAGLQVILRQFQVKKADLVIQFHEFESFTDFVYGVESSKICW